MDFTSTWLKMKSFSQITKLSKKCVLHWRERLLISPAMIFELGQGGVKVATSVAAILKANKNV